MREWIDEQTGMTVRQLTDEPEGACAPYFRMPRHLPGGRIIVHRQHNERRYLTIKPDTGEVDVLQASIGVFIGSNARGEWFMLREKREIWVCQGPEDNGMFLGRLPEDYPGKLVGIMCDGQHVILGEFNYPPGEQVPAPTDKDVAALWRFFNRPRHGKIWTYHLPTGNLRELLTMQDRLFIHHDPSPGDPRLLRYAHDYFDAYCQRIWTVNIDTGETRKIRTQERGEFITHEFWWPDGQHIAFKYQDRRNDPTIEELPWGEYSPISTQIGLADLEGRQVYLSEPINHYHSHIFVSPDGSLLCGEGTEGHCFVYAARFSRDNPRIGFIPHATIHTPYLPFAVGQSVNAGFSLDNRWLIYNDTIDGKLQVCAVRVAV